MELKELQITCKNAKQKIMVIERSRNINDFFKLYGLITLRTLRLCVT